MSDRDPEIRLTREDLERAGSGEPVFVGATWSAPSAYRAALETVPDDALGHPIVRVVCPRCGEQRKGRPAETTIGSVVDTALGALFVADLYSPEGTELGRSWSAPGRRVPAATDRVRVLLEWSGPTDPFDPTECMVDCRHGRRSVTNASVLEAVERYRATGRSQTVTA